MAVYNLNELTKLWAQEKITSEQAIGQILLHISDLVERLNRLEQKPRRNAAPKRQKE